MAGSPIKRARREAEARAAAEAMGIEVETSDKVEAAEAIADAAATKAYVKTLKTLKTTGKEITMLNAGGLVRRRGRRKVKQVRKTSASKDPEKRRKQLSNLTLSRKRGGIGPTIEKVGTVGEMQAKYESPDFTILDFVHTLAESGVMEHLSERPVQQVILKVIYGLPLDLKGDSDEGELYRMLTGGHPAYGGTGLDPGLYVPGTEATEVCLCLGRRSSKSFLTSVVALFEATCRGEKWRKHLRRRETGYITVLATKEQQAKEIIQDNCQDFLELHPILRFYLMQAKALALYLTNSLVIRALPCNTTAGLGYPSPLLIFDEVAHYKLEGTKTATDIFNALEPATFQFTGSKIFQISTPASKQGKFWDWYCGGDEKLFPDGNFQVPGRVTFQAPTYFVNPKVDLDRLEKKRADDPIAYSQNVEAKFVDQVSAFFDVEMLAGCSRFYGDRPADEGNEYFLGIDQSGLTAKGDRFGVAVAHRSDDGEVVVDAVRAYGSTDKGELMNKIRNLCLHYGIQNAMIDKYARGWVETELQELGLDVGTRPTLQIVYLNARGLMGQGRLILPNNPELRAGLINTKAFYGRNNALSIQHDRRSQGGQHADMADAALTAVFQASGEEESSGVFVGVGGGVERGAERRSRLIGAR